MKILVIIASCTILLLGLVLFFPFTANKQTPSFAPVKKLVSTPIPLTVDRAKKAIDITDTTIHSSLAQIADEIALNATISADTNLGLPASSLTPEQQVQQYKQSMNQVISEKMMQLQILQTKIYGSPQIDDSEKTILATQLNTAITNLGQENLKIEKEVSMDTLQKHVKEIQDIFQTTTLLQKQISYRLIVSYFESLSFEVNYIASEEKRIVKQVNAQAADKKQTQNIFSDIEKNLLTLNTIYATDKKLAVLVTLDTQSPTANQLQKDFANAKNLFLQIDQDFVGLKQLLFP